MQKDKVDYFQKKSALRQKKLLMSSNMEFPRHQLCFLKQHYAFLRLWQFSSFQYIHSRFCYILKLIFVTRNM